MKNLELLVTLWPTFPFFERFAKDGRVQGIRLNSAMINMTTLHDELDAAKRMEGPVPLYFDLKGKQLRVIESTPFTDHLELKLNHKIKVKTPTVVLFKGGEDDALLKEVRNGDHLIFEGGPEYMVKAGESLHIRHPSLQVFGKTFTDYEIEKIEKAKKAGFNKFFLSYVESQRHIDELREYVGDSEIVAKIENKKGLQYVASEFRKRPYLSLALARGDLYVEVDKPHDILEAHKLIISKDPDAIAGSRMMLSLTRGEVPECSDFCELAWIADIGYRRFLLCDDLCLKEKPLAHAVNVFDHFRNAYKPFEKEGSFKRIMRKYVFLN